MARSDAERLEHMLEAAERITNLVRGLSLSDLKNDEVLSLAITHLLEILGEAAKGVSQETRNQHPDIPWAQMAATRDRLIHGYFSVDLDIVWQIVRNDLPPVVTSLKAAIGQQ